jgi:hypothetical protein
MYAPYGNMKKAALIVKNLLAVIIPEKRLLYGVCKGSERSFRRGRADAPEQDDPVCAGQPYCVFF